MVCRRRSARRASSQDRTVVCFAGDGDFLMNGQEFARPPLHHNIPLMVVLIDNGIYGTIRMHQERTFPGRIFGDQLSNPDFAAYARAFGGHGETVRRPASSCPPSSARWPLACHRSCT